ncbi:MAG: tetratricopeptide repeat protein [Deltaproteobacteria bacterium]|nr:tetratricopeptide repeat protein [Deltaproteobacteria bacterium]
MNIVNRIILLICIVFAFLSAFTSELNADMISDSQSDIDTRIDILYTVQQISHLNKDVNAFIIRREADAVNRAKQSLKEATESLVKIEHEKRQNEIKGLTLILNKYPSSPLIPYVILRLAELHYEHSNDLFMQSMRQFEKGLSTGKSTGPPPHISYSTSISLYKRFLSQFPHNKYDALAYYLMGYCYGEEGNEKEAADSYITLTKLFPESTFMPEVWFRIGEYYFNNDLLSSAENAYSNAMKYKNSQFYDMALYKLAWTYYRENKYDQALSFFVQVVNRADMAAGSEKRESMKNEAIEYISLIFGENKPPTDADAFLKSIKWNRYYPLIMNKIGAIYTKLALYDFAIQAYNYTTQNAPETLDSLEALYGEMELYEKIGKFNNANDVRLNIIQNYGVGSPFLAGVKENTTKKYAINLVKKAMLSLVKDLIALPKQKHKQPTTGQYLSAQKILESYISEFPGDKELPIVYFFYADIAYQLKNYALAGEFYSKAALTPMYEDNKYRSDAAFDMVKSYEENLNITDTSTYYNKLTVFVNACDMYVSLYPENPDSPKMLYKSGEVLYKADYFTDSIKVFRKLLLTYPNDSLIMDSLKYIVSAFIADKNDTGLESWAVKTLKYNILRNNNEAIMYLKNVLGKLWFVKANKAYDKAQWKEAYRYYKKAVAYINSNQQDKTITIDSAVYNMGVVLNKLNRFKEARSVFNTLIKNYPSSKFVSSARLELGLSYEKALRFNKAIEMYESIINNYSESDKAKDAMFNLAILKEKLGQYGDAASEYGKYEKLYASKDEKPKIALFTAEDYSKAGNTGKALNIYKDVCYNSADVKISIQACFKAGKMLEIDSSREAKKFYDRVISQFDKLNANENAPYLFYYAGARFFNAKEYFALYNSLKFKSTAKLQKVFTEKTNMLAKLNKILTGIVDLGVPHYVIAASYLDANAYEQFYTDVMNSPVPKGLSDAEQNIYMSVLSEKVLPVKNNAIGIYKKTLNKAYQFGITNKYVVNAKEGLDRLDPNASLSYPDRELNILKTPVLQVSTEKINITAEHNESYIRRFRGPFLLFYESNNGYRITTLNLGTD